MPVSSDSAEKVRERRKIPEAHEVEIRRMGTRVIIHTRDLDTAQAVESAMKFWVLHGRPE